MKRVEFICDGCGTAHAKATNDAAFGELSPMPWMYLEWVGDGADGVESKRIDFCPKCGHDFRAVLKRFLADQPKVV